MNTTAKKLLFVLALGTLLPSAFSAPALTDTPALAIAPPATIVARRAPAAAELATYREQAAHFRATVPPRTAGARFDTTTVVVVVVVAAAVVVVAVAGSSNSITIKP
jgi:hypothetical protein